MVRLWVMVARRWWFSAILLASLVLVAVPVRAQDGRQLIYGAPVEGTINREAFREVYFFQARRGDIVSLRMTPTSGDLDPLLLLLDAGGNLVAVSDDRDGLAAVIPPLTVDRDTLYVVVATRFGHGLGLTQGDYELLLTREGVVSQAGVFLSYGDSVIGTIDENATQIVYRFEAQRGDILNLHMERISGNLDPYVFITDTAGQLLTENDDLDGSFDAAIRDYLILDPGVYTIVATRYGQEAGTSEGSFVLSLDTAPTSGLGRSPDAALFLRYGDSLRGEIDGENTLQYFTFGAQRGDVITIRMTRTGGSLDPLLILLREDLTPLIEDDDSGPDNNALIESYTIPEDGAYYILATRYQREGGVTAGSYDITLEGITGQVPLVAPGTPTILYGSALTGEITDEAPVIAYAFLGSAGDVIDVEMTATGGDLDPQLFLFTSAGTPLAADDDSGPEQDALIAGFALPEDTTYYILATRFELQEGTTTGSFRLSLALQGES